MAENMVVVTGIGVISPIGNNAKDFWEALKQGKSGIAMTTGFDVSGYDSRISGEVKGFDPVARGISKKESIRMERFIQFGVVAAKEAVSDSGIDLAKEDPERIGVLVGSGIGSLRIIEEQHKVLLKSGPGRISPFLIPMLIANEAAGHIAIALGAKGPNCCVTTACASGSHSIGDAFRIIQRGDADVMVAGGTESCIVPLGVGGFCALKALSTRNDDPQKASRPFDTQRDGFVMAEGSGIVVLESLEHARKRGASIYAEVAGFGMSGDAYHITAPDPEGRGASNAMKWAMKDARLIPEKVTYINAHGTSTRLNDAIETRAIKDAFGPAAKRVMISSTKSMTGHLLGAAGGVEFAACCLSVRYDLLAPTINYQYPDPECDLDYVPNTARQVKVEAALSNSLGFGGHNAALAVKKFLG